MKTGGFRVCVSGAALRAVGADVRHRLLPRDADGAFGMILYLLAILLKTLFGWSVPAIILVVGLAEGKISLGSFSLADWAGETFWVTFIYAVFINLQNLGIDQSFTQRYISAAMSIFVRKPIVATAVFVRKSISSTCIFVMACGIISPFHKS